MYAVRIFNSDYFTIQNLEISNTGKERKAGRTGLKVECTDYGISHNIRINNLTIRDVNGSLVKEEGGGSGILIVNGGDSIRSRFDSLTIENCHILRCERNAMIWSGYYDRKNWYPNKHTIVRNNLIEKVPGDGIVPTGGYIAGRKDLVELCAYRLNAPGLGKDLGCTLETPRDMYLGFYYAPGVVCEAIKTAIYAQCLLELLGKNPIPRYCDDHNDIVTCFDAGTADALVGFCRGVQAASPVDSYAAPEPCPEPGYTDEVIMASGSFTQGSTIELSCDGPLRAPYTCYLQGGLNFAASRAGVLLAVQNAYFKN